MDDFASYWEKGFVDPALAGTWKKIGVPDQELSATPGPEELRFSKNGTAYSLQAYNSGGRKEDQDARYAVRTLKIGRSFFFMITGNEPVKKGMIEKYQIQGDILEELVLKNGKAVDFLQTKHPTARNIGKNVGEGNYAVIHTFDDEVFLILNEIADDPAYWDLQCRYKKT